jgi:phosphoserine phosphatase
VSLSPGAEQLIAELKRLDIKTLLISGGFDYFTERLKTRLGLDYSISNRIEIKDGRLTGRILGKILNGQGKADYLDRIRVKLGLLKEQTIAIGDGANDLKMLSAAGISTPIEQNPWSSHRPITRWRTLAWMKYSGCSPNHDREPNSHFEDRFFYVI